MVCVQGREKNWPTPTISEEVQVLDLLEDNFKSSISNMSNTSNAEENHV